MWGFYQQNLRFQLFWPKKKAILKDLGLNVEIKSFTSPNDRNVAVQAKELDATISDVMTEATFKQNGIDMTITSDILEDF